MITHIKMQNFKSWKDSGEVKLAPLTGFFGTNSSGKSSLLQMLLLLKQTAERADPEEVVFFGDETSLVNLGDFGEVIYGGRNDTEFEELVMEFGCRLNSPPYKVLVDNSGHAKIDGFDFYTHVINDQEGPVVQHFSYFSHQLNVEWTEGYLDLNREETDNPVTIKSCYGVSPLSRKYLNQFTAAFESLFSHVYYLSPVRSHPQRCYHWDGKHPRDLGMWGDKAIQALLSARLRNLQTDHNESALAIEERISVWLQQMELGDSFSLGPRGSLDNNNYEIRIQKSPASAAVTLVDMGYGLGQFLPVLVLCYYVPEGSTLILEQPGIHLHPKAQSQLADLFIEVVTERKLQILVESHSEHLLTRLQRRIAEKKIAQDDTALYFCRNNDGFSTIERLEVNEFGEIKNWPENFFGDVMGDMFAMTDVQAKRMAQQNPED